jgi:hypothetical protein
MAIPVGFSSFPYIFFFLFSCYHPDCKPRVAARFFITNLTRQVRGHPSFISLHPSPPPVCDTHTHTHTHNTHKIPCWPRCRMVAIMDTVIYPPVPSFKNSTSFLSLLTSVTNPNYTQHCRRSFNTAVSV